MKISPNALYLDLLQDLSTELPDFWYKYPNDQMFQMEDLQPKEFAAISLMHSIYKKNVDMVNSDVDERALETFLTSNTDCEKWELRPETSWDEQLLGEFENSLHQFFFPSSVSSILDYPSEFFDLGGTGPGSSVGSRGEDFYTKLFDSPLAATSDGIVKLYLNYANECPSWALANNQRLTQHGAPSIVAGNRLTFAPKNQRISRVICTEPVLNMYGQLGIGRKIEDRLKKYGIHLSYQPHINRQLAKVGSMDGSLSTVDLSSASDTIALRMCKEFLPRCIYSALTLFRSPKCTLPGGKVLELHMMSSMGNGFTFPLETAIFFCVLQAVYRTMNIALKHSNLELETPVLGNYGVFGDDIICETRAYPKLYRLLSLLGFAVNAKKSFFEGRFRESCGGDFYKGHSVRGVYLKTLRTQASRYVAINRLNSWSRQTGIKLPASQERLLKSVRYLPVPMYANDDSGIKVPYSQIENTLPRCEHTGSVLYKSWSPKPRKLKISECDIKVPRGEKFRNYNPEALLITFLRGDIDRSSMTIKAKDGVTYFAKRQLSPCWDFEATVSTPKG